MPQCNISFARHSCRSSIPLSRKGKHTDDLTTVISVFYIRSGIISDNDSFVYGSYEISSTNSYEFMTPFITELYTRREYIPKEILLSFDYPSDELELATEYINSKANRKITIRTPQKGDLKRMCEMVYNNAKEQATQYKNKVEEDSKVLVKLAEMLGLGVIPERIEAYDISNLGNEHITAGMVVSENGKLKKSDYRFFKIKNQEEADDYSSMRQVIRRRIEHLSDSDGSFSKMPDLILLDGGMTHVSAVKEVLDEMNISIPVFGMVKDEHHKTRTIVTQNEEISIAKEQSVFIFAYKLQEEVHRFTVSKMDSAKRKTLKKSYLENIDGIGAKKAKSLMAHFKTLSAIKEATAEELIKVKGISDTNANDIIEFLKEYK